MCECVFIIGGKLYMQLSHRRADICWSKQNSGLCKF